MKKFILFLLVLVLLFSSCATRIPITYQKPAKFDMKEFRNLGVNEVKLSVLADFRAFNQKVDDLTGDSGFTVYSDYQLFTERSIAQYLEKQLEKELFRSNYFSLLSKFDDSGAILEPTIVGLDLKQYIFGKKEKDGSTKYYLKQNLSLAVNFKVIDINRYRVIYNQTLRESIDKEYYLDANDSLVLFAPEVLPLFEELSDSIASQISALLQPAKISTSVAMMANKPFLAEAEMYYEAAKERQWALAFNGFYSLYENYKHLPSGYNAALIKEAVGERDEAIKIMENLYIQSADKKVLKQLSRMEKYKREQEVATEQY